MSHSFNTIHFLRFIAAFLIINSHSDKLFPDGMQILGTGGSIGNAVFFFTSGFTLAIGLRKPQILPFKEWIYKRLNRLYPSVILFMVVISLFGLQKYEWHDWILFQGSWFLQAIVLFYIIYYFIIRFLDRYIYHLMLAVYLMFVVYYAYIGNAHLWTIDEMDNPYRVHWIYYFMFMLLGGVCSRSSSINPQNMPIRRLLVYSIFSTVAVILFYVPKYLFKIYGSSFGNLQFVYPLLLLLAIYTIFNWAVIVTYIINSKLKFLIPIVVFTANITLEIYIVHFKVIALLYFLNVSFPVNWVFAICTTVLFAYILSKSTDVILNFKENIKAMLK